MILPRGAGDVEEGDAALSAGQERRPVAAAVAIPMTLSSHLVRGVSPPAKREELRSGLQDRMGNTENLPQLPE